MKLSKRKIEILLAENEMTMNELMIKSKVSLNTVYNCFHSDKATKPVTIGKIAHALNCKVVDVIEDED